MDETPTSETPTPTPPSTVPWLARGLALLVLVAFFFGEAGSAPRVGSCTLAGLAAEVFGRARATAQLPFLAFAGGNVPGAVRTLEQALWLLLLLAPPLAALVLVLVPRGRLPRVGLAAAVAGATTGAALVVRMRMDVGRTGGLADAAAWSVLLTEWFGVALTLALGVSALGRTAGGTRGGRWLLAALALLPVAAFLAGPRPLVPAYYRPGWSPVLTPLLLAGAAFAELVRAASPAARRRDGLGKLLAALALLLAALLVARTLRPPSARDRWTRVPLFRDVLRGREHESATVAVAFSPAGDLLVSAVFDGPVEAWDPVSGRLVRRLGTAPPGLRALAFAPTGELVVAGFHGETSPLVATVLDPRTGEVRRELEGMPGSLGLSSYSRALAFSSAGDRLALARAFDSTSGALGGVELWTSDGRSLGGVRFERDVASLALPPGDALVVGYGVEPETEGAPPAALAPETVTVVPALGWTPLALTVAPRPARALAIAGDELLVASRGVVARGARGSGPAERRIDLAAFPELSPTSGFMLEEFSSDGAWWVATDGAVVVAAPTAAGAGAVRVARLPAVPEPWGLAVSRDGRYAAFGRTSMDASPIVVSLEDRVRR